MQILKIVNSEKNIHWRQIMLRFSDMWFFFPVLVYDKSVSWTGFFPKLEQDETTHPIAMDTVSLSSPYRNTKSGLFLHPSLRPKPASQASMMMYENSITTLSMSVFVHFLHQVLFTNYNGIRNEKRIR